MIEYGMRCVKYVKVIMQMKRIVINYMQREREYLLEWVIMDQYIRIKEVS
jgi:hypothetical protein